MTKFYTGTATIDRRLQIVRADEQFYEYIGGDNYASLAGVIHPDGLLHLKKILDELGAGENTALVVRIKAIDGSYHHVFAEFFGLAVEEDKEPYIEVRIQDINALEEKLQGLCDENRQCNELLDMWGEHLFLYDVRRDALQIFNGGSMNRIYSFRGTLEEFRESVLQRGAVGQEYLPVFEEFCQNLAGGVKNFEYKLLLLREDVDPEREIHYVRGSTLSNVREEPMVVGCILRRNNADGSLNDFRWKDSDRDVTTGLLTKKAILEYTEDLLRHKPKYNVNLCVVDIDNFKQVNDTLGHLFGDEVLARVADILKEAVAGKGIVGRIGGDEMFVLLEGVNTLSDLRGILRSIRNNVEWAYKDRKEVPRVTCSIGVSTYPADGYVYEDLFKIADKMLYRAKQKGKNRYIVYAPEIHGDVLSEGEPVNTPGNERQRQDKEDLVLEMLGYVARQTNRPFDMLLQDIGSTFGLDEIHLFYGDAGKVLLESFWNVDGRGKPESSFADYVHEENFVHLYREHNMAVIDKLDLIEQLCPRTHCYMMQRGVKVALIYKMDCKQHEGYIAYCKMSDISRKWSDSDMANLTYISKMLELIINDR